MSHFCNVLEDTDKLSRPLKRAPQQKAHDKRHMLLVAFEDYLFYSPKPFMIVWLSHFFFSKGDELPEPLFV